MTRAAPVGRRRLGTTAWLIASVLLVGLVPVPVVPPADAGASVQLASSRPASAPRPITIGTVPPVAGFPVILEGITSITDAAGKAHFTTTLEGLSDHIQLSEAVVVIDGQEVKVTASRVFYAADGDAARLALDLAYQVRFRFSSMTGEAVDASVIDTVTVKSVTGAVETLPAHETNWLQGSRVVPLTGRLEVKKLDWTVQKVEYSGSNVVNASQQKFVPADQQDVAINLLFFRVSLSLSDAMFGFPQGGVIDLVYPDGKSERFRLDDQGRLTLPTLPRGDYEVTTIGAGPSMTRPLAVSRDQDVELNFYSWLDIGALAAVIFLLALGLPLIGRRRRRFGEPADAGPDDDADEAPPAPAATAPDEDGELPAMPPARSAVTADAGRT